MVLQRYLLFSLHYHTKVIKYVNPQATEWGLFGPQAYFVCTIFLILIGKRFPTMSLSIYFCPASVHRILQGSADPDPCGKHNPKLSSVHSDPTKIFEIFQHYSFRLYCYLPTVVTIQGCITN